MVTRILEALAGFVIFVISSLGLPGIVLLMAIESACIPLPSEVIMPFSGTSLQGGAHALGGVAGRRHRLHRGIDTRTTSGCSAPAPHREVREVHPHVRHDLDLADRWFTRHGEATVFFARLLPVIRTFIAFPAGVARMDMKRFLLYTFAGSFPWCLGLAYLGMVLGEKWPTLREYFHRFDLLIGAVLLAGVVWYVRRHLKNRVRE